MNPRDEFQRRLRLLPTSVKTRTLPDLRTQGAHSMEKQEGWLTSEELEKMLLSFVSKFSDDADLRAQQQPSMTPQAICESAIERARETSAVAIRLAQDVERADEWHRQPPQSFAALMRRFPDIAFAAVSDRRYMLSVACAPHSLRHLHQEVLRRLWSEGVGEFEYPFSSRTRGYRAFCDWLRREVRKELRHELTINSLRRSA